MQYKCQQNAGAIYSHLYYVNAVTGKAEGHWNSLCGQIAGYRLLYTDKQKGAMRSLDQRWTLSGVNTFFHLFTQFEE